MRTVAKDLEEKVGLNSCLWNEYEVEEGSEEVVYFGEAFDLCFESAGDGPYFVKGRSRLVKYRVDYDVKKRLSVDFSPFRVGLKDEVVSKQVKLWAVSSSKNAFGGYFVTDGYIPHEDDMFGYFRSLLWALGESKAVDVSRALIHQVFEPITDYLLDKYSEAKKIENGTSS